MNRRLAIPQRLTPTNSEYQSALGINSARDEDALVQFGFEEVTIVGDVSDSEDESIVAGTMPADGDEPTREYPRRRRPPRGAKRSEWFVRLRLTEDRIAKLWVRRLAPLDVLVWWEENQTWAPLLAVPEMRTAVAAMRDTDEARRHEHGELLPPPPEEEALDLGVRDASEKLRQVERRPVETPPEVEARHGAELQQSGWVEKWRQRLVAEARMTPAVKALISGAQRNMDQAAMLRPKDIRPPPSSLPPMVVDMAPPEIPAAPRAPKVEVPTSHDTGSRANRATPAPTLVIPARVAPTRTASTIVGLLRSRVGSIERALWLAAAAVLMVMVVALVNRRSPSAAQSSDEPTQAKQASAMVRAPVVRTSVVRRPSAPTGAASVGSEPKGGESAASDVPRARDAQAARQATRRAPPSLRTVSRPPVSQVAPATGSPPTTGGGPQPEVGAFDRGGARRALISAAQRVAYCGEGPISGSVVVTFVPSGFVRNVSLATLVGENVRADCVLRAFQAVRITPYSGAPVTASKSFRVN